MSFTARLLITVVSDPSTSVLCSMLVIVPAGCVVAPAPNGSIRRECPALPISRIFDDSSWSIRMPDSFTLRVPVSVTLNAGYGVFQIDVSG